MKIVIASLLLLLVAQLIPVSRENPAVSSEVPAGATVRSVLERSCYDCHSNQTRWPWYARIAPVSWLVVYDVNEAREHVNFSTWDQYTVAEREHNFEEIHEMIDEDEMPLWYYLPLHPEATLSEADRKRLLRWSKAAPGVRDNPATKSNTPSAEDHQHSDH